MLSITTALPPKTFFCNAGGPPSDLTRLQCQLPGLHFLQESDCCPASQERITFVPSVEELCEVAVPHLEKAENAIVSFGQGCEGEPILQADRICEAVRAMRRRTSRGTINFNTNGSIPDAVDKLAEAGIDSIRISLNSVREKYYQAYYRTSHYGFQDVIEAIHRAKKNGLYTMLNYLVFPGMSDQASEVDILVKLLEETGLDMIQMRNLSIDPIQYIREMPLEDQGMGMKKMLDHIKRQVPRIQYGYFNRTRETFFPPDYENDWPVSAESSRKRKRNPVKNNGIASLLAKILSFSGSDRFYRYRPAVDCGPGQCRNFHDPLGPPGDQGPLVTP